MTNRRRQPRPQNQKRSFLEILVLVLDLLILKLLPIGISLCALILSYKSYDLSTNSLIPRLNYSISPIEIERTDSFYVSSDGGQISALDNLDISITLSNIGSGILSNLSCKWYIEGFVTAFQPTDSIADLTSLQNAIQIIKAAEPGKYPTEWSLGRYTYSSDYLSFSKMCKYQRVEDGILKPKSENKIILPLPDICQACILTYHDYLYCTLPILHDPSIEGNSTINAYKPTIYCILSYEDAQGNSYTDTIKIHPSLESRNRLKYEDHIEIFPTIGFLHSIEYQYAPEFTYPIK